MFEAFCGDQRFEWGWVNRLQMKVYIYYKTLPNRIRIQKSAFKN